MLLQQKNKTILLSSLSVLFYFLMAYSLDRTNFSQLIAQYFILFIPFYSISNFICLFIIFIFAKLLLNYCLILYFLIFYAVSVKKAFFIFDWSNRVLICSDKPDKFLEIIEISIFSILLNSLPFLLNNSLNSFSLFLPKVFLSL